MLDWLAQRLEVTRTVAAIVLAVLAVQLTTQVVALVDLARRDAVRGGKKWLWALIVAFGNLPGAVVYLAMGRHVPMTSSVPDREAGTGDPAARRAVDVLYGRRDEQ